MEGRTDKGTSGTQSAFMLDTFPGNSLRIIVRTGTYEGTVGFPAALATDKWSHGAGVIDAVSGAMTLYLNGRSVAANTFEPAAKLPGNEHPLCVGLDHRTQTREIIPWQPIPERHIGSPS